MQDYQQYADHTQLYLSVRTSDSAHHLDILRACSTALHDWYLAVYSRTLLNADKTNVILLGTASQLRLVASVDSVEVAGVTLPVASTLKSLGVILDQQLTFDDHTMAIAKSCNYHTWAIKHVRHLLPESVARTLACSLISSWLDYCHLLLHRVPESTIKTLQRSQNNTARVVLAAMPLLCQLRGCTDMENLHVRCSDVF